ncbi:hypothetical protein C4556_03070 [Candidatus Parcubacteria bacterium]|nr:MAG: hypothetical protein C4556_03070 [Candidatus Parcubacteria bacterium]
MTELIARAFPWILLAPAVLPLVYVEGLLYPFVAPKTLFFRALAIVAAAAFVYLVFSGHTFRFGRLRHLVSWIPGALLVVAYITSFVGTDFYHSFWSIYDRGDGLLTLTAAVLFFYLILLYADKDFLRRLLTAVAWVGSLVALYAVLQWLQLTFGVNIPLITDETRGRVGSTLGNAAFLAAYLGLTFFATLSVVSEYWRAMRHAPWTAKVLFSGAALQLLAIFLTATRGGILAFVLIGLLITVYLAWRGEGRRRTYARGGLAAALLVAALFVGFREQIAQVPIAPLQRIASISLEDVTVSSRLFVWENVGREALKQPITGVGAEHVDILFNRVYDPSAIVEQWFDRSHNAYLDYFVQYGILGFLLYFALVASLAWTSWRLWQKRGEQPLGDLKATYGLYILLAVLVYAMQNFFVFDTSMTLWLLLALLAAAYAASDETTSTTPSRITLPRHVSLLAGVVILTFLYPVFIQPLRANLALAEAYIYHIVDIDRTTSVLERGLSLNTYADIEYGYQLYSMYTDRQQHMLEGEELITAYEFARDTLAANYERYPYDARTAVYLAHVLDSAPEAAEVDEEFLRAVLARAIELSPKRIQPWYLLANISLKKGDAATGIARNQAYREAIEVLKEYTELVPNYAEPRFIIAGLYLVMGERIEAANWAAEGLALYTKPHADTAQRAIKYYIGIEDWPNALRFMQDFVSEDSEKYEEVYDLAKLYFLTGDKDKALQIVERLRRDAPGLVETDPAFMQAIGS